MERVSDHLGNEYKSITNMCKHWGIAPGVFSHRIYDGWDLEDALTIPTRRVNHINNANKCTDHLGNEFRSLNEMCEHYGIESNTFTQRLGRGWGLKQALTEPVIPNPNRANRELKEDNKKCKYIDPEGNQFDTKLEMCKHWGVRLDVFNYREALGYSLEQCLNGKKVVDHLGNEFSTQVEMCDYWGVNIGTYNWRRRSGWDLEESLTCKDKRKVNSNKETSDKCEPTNNEIANSDNSENTNEPNTQKPQRLNWDEYFMGIAELTSKRSTCLRRQVGAVLVKDRHIIATGYNGSPTGVHNCIDTGNCLREELKVPSGQRHELCYAVHAEANAIIQCAVNGVSCKGATIYVTDSPCSMCLKQIINAGITRIVAMKKYPDELSTKLLQESNVEFEMFNCNNETTEDAEVADIPVANTPTDKEPDSNTKPIEKYSIVYIVKRDKRYHQGGYVVLDENTGKRVLVDMDEFIKAVTNKEIECANGKIVTNSKGYDFIRTDDGVEEITWQHYTNWSDEILNGEENEIKEAQEYAYSRFCTRKLYR
jgi:dCMP deaminase